MRRPSLLDGQHRLNNADVRLGYLGRCPVGGGGNRADLPARLRRGDFQAHRLRLASREVGEFRLDQLALRVRQPVRELRLKQHLAGGAGAGVGQLNLHRHPFANAGRLGAADGKFDAWPCHSRPHLDRRREADDRATSHLALLGRLDGHADPPLRARVECADRPGETVSQRLGGRVAGQELTLRREFVLDTQVRHRPGADVADDDFVNERLVDADRLGANRLDDDIRHLT